MFVKAATVVAKADIEAHMIAYKGKKVIFKEPTNGAWKF